MNDPIDKLTNSLATWSGKAIASGWLADTQAPTVPARDQQSPANLFEGIERPLVVAFFGGTGVGKSSLLNRLAGEAVAKSSAERPTSREITLYLHESVELARLPDELPVERLRQSSHRNEKYRNVLWIDMPDFDSVETANRALVEDWLPHIDMLAYVVNPDRYRDDSGWQMLQGNASRHAWVFIINHWDRGAPEQRDAFHRILTQAGMDDPLIFCTDCSGNPDKPNGDEFENFESAISQMAQQQFIQQLEQHGVLVRIQEATQRLGNVKHQLQHLDGLSATAASWHDSWQQRSKEKLAALDWKFNLLAQPFKVLDRGFTSSLLDLVLRRKQGEQDLVPRLDIDTLIDQDFVAATRIGLDQAVQDSVSTGVPIEVAQQINQPDDAIIRSEATAAVNTAVDKSVAQPGTALQRKLGHGLQLASMALPLAAIAWALYRLLSTYYEGNQYLGLDFATHTLLITLCAFLIPWILKRLIKPTHEQAAQQGQRAGLQDYLEKLGQDTKASMQELDKQRTALINDSDSALEVLPQRIRDALKKQQNPDQSLSRVVASGTAKEQTGLPQGQ